MGNVHKNSLRNLNDGRMLLQGVLLTGCGGELGLAGSY
jgi:hypothetical protein